MRTSLLALLVVFVAATAGAVPVITNVDPFEGFSFGPTHITIIGSGFTGGAVEVFFDDVKATVLESDATRLYVLALPTADGSIRQDGLADITVRVAGHGETTLANGFRFSKFALGGEEDYTPVLIPLAAGTIAGANGSLWTSELRVFNSSTLTLHMPGPEETFQSPPFDPDIYVGARKTQQVFLSRQSGALDGAFLYVPKPLADAPKWSLRVRDLSKNAASLGTAIPVVKAGDFHGDIVLHDLPIDPNTRATLRIYGLTEAPMEVGISVYAENINTVIEQRNVRLEGTEHVVHDVFPPFPAYAVLDPFSQFIRESGLDRVRIEITNYNINLSPPPPPIWAFVSFTNNTTQQVTVVTSQ